jgi:hypothetical protein
LSDSPQANLFDRWYSDLVACLNEILKSDTNTTLPATYMHIATFLMQYRNSWERFSDWTQDKLDQQILKASGDKDLLLVASSRTLKELHNLVENVYSRKLALIQQTMSSWKDLATAVEFPAENTRYGCVKFSLFGGIASLRFNNELTNAYVVPADVYYMGPAGMTKADSPLQWNCKTLLTEFLSSVQTFINHVEK